MTVAPSLLSADIDLFCDDASLQELVAAARMDKLHTDFYVQVSSALNFQTSPLWGTRSQSVRIGNCTFVIPHPIDILIAKLNRLEEKDLAAFRVVLKKTGHPTEAELIRSCNWRWTSFVRDLTRKAPPTSARIPGGCGRCSMAGRLTCARKSSSRRWPSESRLRPAQPRLQAGIERGTGQTVMP